MTAPAAWIEIARIPRVLAQVPDAHSTWLSESELTRLASLRHAPRRAQYLAGHWLVRVLLARAFGGIPTDWRLLERRSLPPKVQGHDALRVSISHTDDWVAAAIANVPIGIDLEPRTRLLDAAIEPVLLNSDEARGSLDADTLLQRWVAKEAWLKREAGSALPERLERLHLRTASREHADVSLDSHDAFQFALAIAPGCTVSRCGDLTLEASAAFAVTDLDMKFETADTRNGGPQ